MFKINKDKIIAEFENYLITSGISKRTVKYYRSDINHFKSWVLSELKSLGVIADDLSCAIPFLNETYAKEYKTYLVENKLSLKTTNRRLSALRRLSKYLLYSQIVSTDFAKDLTNTNPIKQDNVFSRNILQEFQKYLEAEKTSRNTIKNYVADIRQFIVWFEQNNKFQI